MTLFKNKSGRLTNIFFISFAGNKIKKKEKIFLKFFYAILRKEKKLITNKKNDVSATLIKKNVLKILFDIYLI